MIATAYVLVRIEAGKARKIYDELLNVKGVQNVDAVSGPYDFILTIQASDFNALGELVLNKIHPIKGISETMTCNVIKFEP